jgi:hypothetical protein
MDAQAREGLAKCPSAKQRQHKGPGLLLSVQCCLKTQKKSKKFRLNILSIKREQTTDTYYNMDGTQKHAETS